MAHLSKKSPDLVVSVLVRNRKVSLKRFKVKNTISSSQYARELICKTPSLDALL